MYTKNENNEYKNETIKNEIQKLFRTGNARVIDVFNKRKNFNQLKK